MNIKLRLPFDVYIGRARYDRDDYRDGYFGNPFSARLGRSECIARFRSYFLNRVETDLRFLERVLELKDKTLGCFCKPFDCHGDVIAEWLDSQGK